MVTEEAGYFLRKGTPCIITLLDCKFRTLLRNLRAKNLPSIVIRTLVFVNEQQT